MVEYPEFKDLQWRAELPTSSMHDNVPGELQFSVQVTYTEGGVDKQKWLTLDYAAAAALHQDVHGAIFSLTAPHTRRIGRIVK